MNCYCITQTRHEGVCSSLCDHISMLPGDKPAVTHFMAMYKKRCRKDIKRHRGDVMCCIIVTGPKGHEFLYGATSWENVFLIPLLSNTRLCWFISLLLISPLSSAKACWIFPLLQRMLEEMRINKLKEKVVVY